MKRSSKLRWDSAQFSPRESLIQPPLLSPLVHMPMMVSIDRSVFTTDLVAPSDTRFVSWLARVKKRPSMTARSR
jgi:hypothetical protein